MRKSAASMLRWWRPSGGKYLVAAKLRISVLNSVVNREHGTIGVRHDVLGSGVRQMGDCAHRIVRVNPHDDEIHSVRAGELQDPVGGKPKLYEVIRVRKQCSIGRNEFAQELKQRIRGWLRACAAGERPLHDMEQRKPRLMLMSQRDGIGGSRGSLFAKIGGEKNVIELGYTAFLIHDLGPNREDGATSLAKYRFCDRPHEQLAGAGASMTANDDKVDIVLDD